MMKIKVCPHCKKYTMQKHCPACNAPTIIAKPPKYSPEDRYGDLRRRAKEEEI
jgi:H/ACA ribonucleoprotein complex subunit 3